MKVLLIAEAANPEWTSVPLIGWSLSQALRARADVHLVTHLRNRDAIVRAGLVEGTDFTAIDADHGGRFWYRLADVLRKRKLLGWTAEMALGGMAYRHFEHLVWQQFGDALRAGDYDLVHRITPLSPTVVSSLAARCRDCKVPFVLGPLNGGAPWPAAFDTARRQEKEWLSYVRGLHKWMPGHHTMLQSAARILVGSRHTLQDLPARLHAKCEYMPENAVDPARFPSASQTAASAPLRAAFVGRLVPYKGPDMLLEAAAPLLGAGALTLDIIGDGPLMPDLRAWVKAHQLEAQVHFHGWVAHDRVHAVLSKAQLFAFPSIREFGGGAVLEAMALGVVPMVVDYAGPGELVDDDVGFRIPLGDRPSIIQAFRKALEDVASSPQRLAVLSRNGRQRVQDRFTWAVKAERIVAVYAELLGRVPHPAGSGH